MPHLLLERSCLCFIILSSLGFDKAAQAARSSSSGAAGHRNQLTSGTAIGDAESLPLSMSSSYKQKVESVAERKLLIIISVACLYLSVLCAKDNVRILRLSAPSMQCQLPGTYFKATGVVTKHQSWSKSQGPTLIIFELRALRLLLFKNLLTDRLLPNKLFAT